MPIALNFLPAKFGDCIWIEYGTPGDTHRILIDGGTAGTRNILKQMIDDLPDAERHFDLVVVTHIDRDHIEGILGLLEDADELNFTIGDFWFNGFKHLPEDDNEAFGAVQGERLTAAILKHQLPWNITFDGNAVVIEDENNLPVINLAGNMKLTLLSPYIEHLVKLRPKWEEEVKAAGLVPGFGMEEGAPEVDDPDVEGFGANPDIEVLNNSVFKEDDAKANGSSIALLLEHDGNTVLLAGDAYPGTVLRSLNVLFDNKAPVDVFKLSHHGSSHNTSPALIEKVDCKKYVISTNGAIFKHPSQPTMSWVIKRGGTDPELIFNYTTEFTSIWNSLVLEQQFNYTTTFPADEGIEVILGN